MWRKRFAQVDDEMRKRDTTSVNFITIPYSQSLSHGVHDYLRRPHAAPSVPFCSVSSHAHSAACAADRLHQRQGHRRDGSVLPGVTVEARVQRAAAAPRHRHRRSGEYRLPALVPGTYTVDVHAGRDADGDAQVPRSSSAGHAVDATLGVAGVSESITVTAEARSSTSESAAIQSGISSQEIQCAAGGAGVPRPAEADPGRQYTQDTVRGPSAGAQRPGQRLQVRRRQRHDAAVRHAVRPSRPRTTSRRSRSSRAARRRSTSTAPAASRSTRSASPARTSSPARSATRCCNRELHRRSEAARNLTYERGPRLGITANIGGPILPDRLFFYGSYYRPDVKRRQPGQPLRRAARVRQHAQRGLRQADVHADSRRCSSTAAIATRSATTRATLSARLRAGDDRHGHREPSSRSARWKARGSSTRRSYATFKYTDFRNPGIGTGRYHRATRPWPSRSARSSTSPTSTRSAV